MKSDQEIVYNSGQRLTLSHNVDKKDKGRLKLTKVVKGKQNADKGK